MKSFTSALGLALLLATVGPALAASPAAKSSAASPAPAATLLPVAKAMSTGSPNKVGDISVRLAVIGYSATAYGERASKIIGSTVYNQQKQAIGRVSDLVINPRDSVSIVIVSVGGFLGMGAKDVAISAKNFEFKNHSVVLPRATKEVLEQLPAFKFSKK